ncbi:DMT family transporter [Acinetobacter equi]|nr:DMT family transporter [Acinetobacter equi]
MMKMYGLLFLLIPLAIGIGVALTLQTAINSQLKEYLSSHLQTALFSFLIGTIALCCLVFIENSEKPNLHQILTIPWYLWLGGYLGAYAITVSIFSAPKLGFLSFSGLVIFGQIMTSMILDHYGFLGVDKTPIHWQRFLGGVVIFIGVLLTLQR